MFLAKCPAGHENKILGDAPHPFGPLRRCTVMVDENGGTCGQVIQWESPIKADHPVPQITDVKQF